MQILCCKGHDDFDQWDCQEETSCYFGQMIRLACTSIKSYFETPLSESLLLKNLTCFCSSSLSAASQINSSGQRQVYMFCKITIFNWHLLTSVIFVHFGTFIFSIGQTTDYFSATDVSVFILTYYYLYFIVFLKPCLSWMLFTLWEKVIQ